MNSQHPKQSFQKKLLFIFFLLTILAFLLGTTLAVLITKRAEDSFIVVVIFLIFILLFIIFHVAQELSKPLILLDNELKEVSKVHFDKTLEIKTNDEVGSIKKSVNNMLHILQQREEDFKIVTSLRDGEKERITNQRNMLEVILSGISEGVVAIDADKKILLFNKAVESLTGMNSQSAVGRHIDDVLQFFDNKDRITAALYLGQSEKIAQRFVEKGLQISNFQGKKIIISLTTSPMTLVDQSIGWIITFHDITKEIEEEGLKIDFVSMAAHELRTPLTSVRGYASLLKMQNEKELGDKGKESLERLSVSSEILANLVENLLNVTRIEQNRFTVTTQNVDLTSTITNAVTNLQQQAQVKHLKLELQIKGKLPIVIADPFRITQVLTNLVANAIHYTSEGGTITTVAEEQNNFLQIAITDTGEGIPENALPKLFTKFFRVSADLNEGSKGTGLGLFITKSIIELHKGKIWVTSEFGKGSTFTFILPKAELQDTKK